MSTQSILWGKLAASKQYREEFVASQVKQGIPFQIHAMRKAVPMSQEELAERSQLTQGVVSRAEDPDYGNLTLNTIIRIAAGFDVAFIGNFVPFSDLVDWFENLSEDSVRVETFEEENRRARHIRPHVMRRGRTRRKRSVGMIRTLKEDSQSPNFGKSQQLSLLMANPSEVVLDTTIPFRKPTAPISGIAALILNAQNTAPTRGANYAQGH